MIKIYSMPNCIYCKQLKELLDKDNIQYKDVNIDLPENDAEYEQIRELTKCDSVPIVLVGKRLLVPEVSFQSIEEAAKLTKKFLG